MHFVANRFAPKVWRIVQHHAELEHLVNICEQSENAQWKKTQDLRPAGRVASELRTNGLGKVAASTR